MGRAGRDEDLGLSRVLGRHRRACREQDAAGLSWRLKRIADPPAGFAGTCDENRNTPVRAATTHDVGLPALVSGVFGRPPVAAPRFVRRDPWTSRAETLRAGATLQEAGSPSRRQAPHRGLAVKLRTEHVGRKRGKGGLSSSSKAGFTDVGKRSDLPQRGSSFQPGSPSRAGGQPQQVS